MFQGFEPVYDKNSKILILGSFPSVKSRLNGFYYGNKQNRFWKMLSQVFNESVSDNIEKKKEFVLKHNIALYDVVLESDLQGSSDIELEKSNKKICDLSFLLPPFTKVKKIICNGKTAYKLLVDQFQTDIPILCLSSTSPANPRYNFNEWKEALSLI